MRRLLTIGLVLALAGLAVAQDAPRSIAAQRAITRHDQAMRKAEQEYQRAAVAAKRELIAELEQAKAQAMAANQLDEANAIQGAIDEARRGLDSVLGKAQPQTFSIDATKDWQPTIEVNKGQTVTIRARGTWTHFASVREPYDANGWPDPRNNNRRGALFGRIGTQEFPVGKSARFTAPADGLLELRMNDNDHHDNAGTLAVIIEVR
jgi:hypothetical protein